MFIYLSLYHNNLCILYIYICIYVYKEMCRSCDTTMNILHVYMVLMALKKIIQHTFWTLNRHFRRSNCGPHASPKVVFRIHPWEILGIHTMQWLGKKYRLFCCWIIICTLVNDHIAGWNIPIFNRIHTSSCRVCFPASYVSLPEGSFLVATKEKQL